MFSVIIPVHNKLPHIERCVNSVFKQSYQGFELLLIDDASTDGSSEKLQEYNDPRIRLFKRDTPGPGGYAARNLGIKEANYEWLIFLDADDEWHLDTLSQINDLIDEMPHVEIISFDWEMRNKDLIKRRIVQNGDSNGTFFEFSLINYLKNTDLMLTGSFAVHRVVVQKGGVFPSQTGCQRGGDVDTWIRWLRTSSKSIHFNRCLFYYYRDTINRVTGTPNSTFCAYDTLIEIYRKSTDKDLRTAIKSFCNRFLYNMLARKVNFGMDIDYRQIKKMFFCKYTILRILKLHLDWIKNRYNDDSR